MIFNRETIDNKVNELKKVIINLQKGDESILRALLNDLDNCSRREISAGLETIEIKEKINKKKEEIRELKKKKDFSAQFELTLKEPELSRLVEELSKAKTQEKEYKRQYNVKFKEYEKFLDKIYKKYLDIK